MASVNFSIRSKANDSFTARLQVNNPSKISEKNPFGLEFFEARTELYVFSPYEVSQNPFVDGKKFWTRYKNYKGTDISIKQRIIDVLQEQKRIREFVLSKFEEDFEQVNFKADKKWITSVINEYYDSLKAKEEKENTRKLPSDIQWWFENYTDLKKNEFAKGTILKLNNSKNIFREFEKYQSSIKGYNVTHKIDDVSPEFQIELEKFLLLNKKYSHNTIAKNIKILKTICNYANMRGLPLNQSYGFVGKSYASKEVIYLSFKELQLIKNCENIPLEYENARRWLYLSAFLGQRISDFMRFTGKMVRKEKNNYFIDFTQTKTGKKLSLLMHPEVVKFLQNNNMEFPAPIDEPTYNEQIKEVCRRSGITEEMEGSLLIDITPESEESIWRKVRGIHPKYKFIGSHIGRKSYCTNFYGKLPTSLILEVSGHTEERTLLSYIGKKEATNNKLIGQYYKDIDITED